MHSFGCDRINGTHHCDLMAGLGGLNNAFRAKDNSLCLSRCFDHRDCTAGGSGNSFWRVCCFRTDFR